MWLIKIIHMNCLRAFSSDILKHIFGSPLVSYNCSRFYKMLQWLVKISTTVSHINYYSLIFIRSFSLLSDSTSLSLTHTQLSLTLLCFALQNLSLVSLRLSFSHSHEHRHHGWASSIDVGGRGDWFAFEHGAAVAIGYGFGVFLIWFVSSAVW